MSMKNIGIDVAPPQRSCSDWRCPFHGRIKIRGKVLEGRLVSLGDGRSVVILHEYLHYIPKYARYERRRKKIHAHLPPCISAKEGERVLIGECRPLSKTKAFIVLEVRGK